MRKRNPLQKPLYYHLGRVPFNNLASFYNFNVFIFLILKRDSFHRFSLLYSFPPDSSCTRLCACASIDRSFKYLFIYYFLISEEMTETSECLKRFRTFQPEIQFSYFYYKLQIAGLVPQVCLRLDNQSKLLGTLKSKGTTSRGWKRPFGDIGSLRLLIIIAWSWIKFLTWESWLIILIKLAKTLLRDSLSNLTREHYEIVVRIDLIYLSYHNKLDVF